MSKENKRILIRLIVTVLLGIVIAFPLVHSINKNAALKERIEFLKKRRTKPSYKDREVIEFAELGGTRYVVYWSDYEEAKVYEVPFSGIPLKVGDIYEWVCVKK